VVKVLVSGCLLGERVRYDGASMQSDSAILEGWIDSKKVVSVCPEVIGGLGIPRPPAEIVNGDGQDVLVGRAAVVTVDGKDVTHQFMKGAQLALALCLKHDIKVAVLSDSSPSCGSSAVYNGQFTRTKITGVGVTAALLMRHGIKVFSQYQLREADTQLQRFNAS